MSSGMDRSDVAYTDESKRSDSADEAVVAASKNDSRGFKKGLIKCTSASSGKKTWHSGGTDPNAPVHITVEMQDENGNHITTVHLDKNGNRV